MITASLIRGRMTFVHDGEMLDRLQSATISVQAEGPPTAITVGPGGVKRWYITGIDAQDDAVVVHLRPLVGGE